MQIDLHIKWGGLKNMAVKWEDTFCVKRGEDGKNQQKLRTMNTWCVTKSNLLN